GASSFDALDLPGLAGDVDDLADLRHAVVRAGTVLEDDLVVRPQELPLSRSIATPACLTPAGSWAGRRGVSFSTRSARSRSVPTLPPRSEPSLTRMFSASVRASLTQLARLLHPELRTPEDGRGGLPVGPS